MDIGKKIKEVNIRKAISLRKLRAETIDGYRRLLLEIIFAFIAGAIIFTQIFIVAVQTDRRMYPMIDAGDVVIAYRFAYGFDKKYLPKDIVLYKYNEEIYCGRVVAGEEDIVRIDGDGYLYINGTRQDDEILFATYAKEGITYPYTVPENCYFILDDHRNDIDSVDSRVFGPIPKDNIKGKVITFFRTRIT